MSRLLCTNRSFELLEPYDWKLSCTVLRGESSRKGADLLDILLFLASGQINFQIKSTQRSGIICISLSRDFIQLFSCYDGKRKQT